MLKSRQNGAGFARRRASAAAKWAAHTCPAAGSRSSLVIAAQLTFCPLGGHDHDGSGGLLENDTRPDAGQQALSDHAGPVDAGRGRDRRSDQFQALGCLRRLPADLYPLYVSRATGPRCSRR